MTDLDETNVCYLCETTLDCSQGNEVEALSGEWVCLSCQDKLISELAPKIKADAVRDYESCLSSFPLTVGEYIKSKLEGGE